MPIGSFDPATFLDVTLDQANDTKLIPVPAYDYPGICGEPSIRQATSKDGLEQYHFLEVMIELDSGARTADGQLVTEVTGRDKNSVRYSAGLEFTDQGGLATGKGRNVGLGRLREATRLNTPGQPFNMRMFQGRPLKVSVKHRVNPDNGDIYAEVKAVAPL